MGEKITNLLADVSILVLLFFVILMMPLFMAYTIVYVIGQSIGGVSDEFEG